MSWMRKPGSRAAQEPSPARKVRLGLRILPLEDLVDPETGWYQRWYFMARLGDEMSRMRKRRRQLMVVYSRLPLSDYSEDSRWRIYVSLRLSILAREAKQAEGFFGRLSEDEFAICVSGTDSKAAANAAGLLRQRIDVLAGESGTAVFPSDAGDASGLVDAARDNLQVLPPNVVSLDGYRYRRGYDWRPRAA